MGLGSGIRDPGSEIRDPGSGKNLLRIPDPGVKKAPDPGSRIRIRNTASWVSVLAACSSLVDCFTCCVVIDRVTPFSDLESRGWYTGFRSCGSLYVAKKKDRMHQYRRLKAASVQFGIECK